MSLFSRDQVVQRIREVLGIDARSLALFRVGLAILLLFDLSVRAHDMRAHYTDWGVLPRALLMERFPRLYWSIHLANGTVWFEGALFVIAAVFAAMLLIGYRTRLATIASWLLLISLQTRNPVVLQGGDVLLRLLLFWGMFLPLGLKYSLDSLHHDFDSPRKVFSVGTVGLLLQVAAMYLFTALWKSGPDWYPDGTAIYYVLSIDEFATFLGAVLLQFPALLRYLTYAVLLFEFAGPLVLFVPFFIGPVRTVMVFAFVGLQIGMGLCLHLGSFPWIASIAMIPFLPAWFWEKIFARLRTPQRAGLQIFYDGTCGFCRRSVKLIKTFFLLPEVSLAPAQSDPLREAQMKQRASWVVVDATGGIYYGFSALRPIFAASPLLWIFTSLLAIPGVPQLGERVYRFVARHRISVGAGGAARRLSRPRRWGEILANAVAAFFIVYVLLWNLKTLGHNTLSDRMGLIAQMARVDQKWDMFAPSPMKNDGWYVIPGLLADGTAVDVFGGGAPVSYRKPKDVAGIYPDMRWRKYLMNLSLELYAAYRPSYAAYMCRAWNRRHQGARQLRELEIIFVKEWTLPPGQKPAAENVSLGKYSCS